MNNVNYPQARQNGIVVQEMPDEVLVYDVDSSKAHCLNDTAARVWKSCDGTNSVADIVKNFEKTGGGKVTEDFVWLAIDQLNEKGLLEIGVKSQFAGQSRRDVLKKIGLASVVALPIIATLVAPPNALSAVSCVCIGVGPAGDAQCAALGMGCMNMCGGGGTCV
jgi:hypothetical protein